MRKRANKEGHVAEMVENVSKGLKRVTEENSSGQYRLRSVEDSNTKERAYLEAAATETTDIMLSIDRQFQIRDFNKAASRVLGWQEESDKGIGCTEILRCQNLNKIQLCGTSSCPVERVLKRGQRLSHEELYIGVEEPKEVSVAAYAVNKGEEARVVLTARDISSINIVNKMRSNFVSMVSHELRTPLNSVHGFIDLLMLGQMGELSPEQHKYLGYTQEGVQQLISIVEDILFMTRSDSGQFEMQSVAVSIQMLVDQVIGSLQPQAQKAEVSLEKDISDAVPWLYGDPQRIKQVLNNLVTNAIKYTPPDSSVTISAHQQDERFVLISVADTGYGIPVEDRSHIFERFYQSNQSRQSRAGGYGLGLPIAKLIVEQHGGTIWFETELEKGTCFSFTVPIYREEQE